MSQESTKLYLNRRHIFLAILLVFALYIIVPQVGDFRSSWHFLTHPRIGELLIAIGLTMTTYLTGATNYCLLAFRPMRFGQTALVQLAAMFINRLMPGGIGAVGTNYAYLRHRKHTRIQAATVVTVNNLLGGIGHGLLVLCTLIVAADESPLAPSYRHTGGLLLKGVFAVALLVGILVLVFGRNKVWHQLSEIARQLASYRQRPERLLAALLSSIALTLGNVFCLATCALALGVHLPFVVILLIFTFGISAGTATPLPGGLGGFEAGLAAGFIAYHVASSEALAIALLYRLVSYWLPLIIGGSAFVICQRKKLFV